MNHRLPRRLFLICVAWWMSALAHATLTSARQAQAMLGPDTWSRVLDIRNERPGRYPAQLYATVFEFDRALWFYTAVNGTQSLSLFVNRTARDKLELGPLLREIEPGFTNFTELPDRCETPPARVYPALNNGCFVASLHELRQRLVEGEPIIEAGLFAVYYTTAEGLLGHTGLLYRTPYGRYYWDPNRPQIERAAPVEPDVKLIEVARVINDGTYGDVVDRARYLSVPGRELGGAAYVSAETRAGLNRRMLAEKEAPPRNVASRRIRPGRSG